MKNLSPIVLFTYNRPNHTLKVLENLAKNDFAKQSDLFIFSDGAKTNQNSELALIEEVRRIIRKKKWCKNVTLIERTENLGLAKSITTGISEIIKLKGKVIVLEDDILTSKGFLKFMNEGLELYKNDEKVMHISGYMLPLPTKLPDTLFLRVPLSWGWATWDRAWNQYRSNAPELFSELKRMNKLKKFNITKYGDFTKQLEKNIGYTLETWAVKWYATIFLSEGLCLHPKISLIQNIGFDNSGTNCDESQIFLNPINKIEYIELNPIDIKEFPNIEIYISMFYKKNKKKWNWITKNIKLVLFKIYTLFHLYHN